MTYASARSDIKVVMLDPESVTREGLRHLLEHERDMCVVAGAATLRQVAGRGLRPDVVVTEASLPDAPAPDGLIRDIRTTFREAAILVLSSRTDRAHVRRSIQAGALGYLPKTASPHEVVDAIRAISCGEAFLHSAVGVALMATDAGGPSSAISEREMDVVQLVVAGHTSQEIAVALELSVRTVEKHRASAMSKLGIRSRAELVRLAAQQHLTARRLT